VKRLLSFVLLAALLAGVGGCMSVPGLGGGMKITALMGDSAGLFVGNDVGILGVKVGTVTALQPDGTNVRVTMVINSDQPVPANAGAVVVARSVATDRYVELTPVYHPGEARMQSGAVIDETRTRTPVDFDDVLAALNTFATGISGSQATKDAIKRILLAGSTALNGRGTEFNDAITSLGTAVNSISAQRQNITGTVSSLATLTSTIAQNQKLVETFIGEISKASTLLADERGNFQAALESLRTAVMLIAQFAKDNRQQLVTTLNSSTAIMQNLLSQKGQLTETLQVMPVALQNLSRVLHGNELLVRVDPTVLFPGLGGLVDTLCKQQSTQICAAFGPSLLNLNNLLALLGLK
jgi:phospholipid/cholesterol/gamma-HCH transport system substrate-binding protein